MYFVDYTGRRYGKLVVLERGERNEKRKLYSWICQCDCGNTATVIGADLRNGNTISCGCMSSRKVAGDRTRTHGLAHKPIYNVWCAMRNRCQNTNQKSYKDYGAKGIRVCDKWQTFEGFYEDMGSTYKEGLTIERKDLTGNYCLENCEWITKEQQALNKSNLVTITYKGVTAPLVIFCNEMNLKSRTVYFRLRRGWSVEKALETPMK